ncbi:unnamed protein product, partial [Musa hybrid cultivar]
PSLRGRPPRPRHQPEGASTSPTSPAAPGEDAPCPRLLPRRRFRRRHRRLPHVPQLPRGFDRRSRRVRELPPPEDSLPATYDDSLAALRWVASRPQDEDWLAQYGDIGRVFLPRDSEGANM